MSEWMMLNSSPLQDLSYRHLLWYERRCLIVDTSAQLALLALADPAFALPYVYRAGGMTEEPVGETKLGENQIVSHPR